MENYKLLLVTSVQPKMMITLFPDNGLALIASQASKAGFNPKILDFAVASNVGYPGSWEKLLYGWISPEVENGYDVGFKFFANQTAETLSVAQKTRDNFGRRVTLIASGPHVTYSPERFEEFLFNPITKKGIFDFIWSGEGYYAMPALRAFKEGRVSDKLEGERGFNNAHPRMSFYDKEGRLQRKSFKFVDQLDQFSTPDFSPETYPAMNGNEKFKRAVATIYSAGCNYGKCIFCFHPIMSGPYRERSVDKIIEEDLYLNRLGISYHLIGGSSLEPVQANAIAKKRNELGLYVPGGVFINERKPLEYDFKNMRKSGFELVFIGAESANPQELVLLNKCLEIPQLEETVKRAKGEGINVITSFIYLGNEDNAKKTVELIKKIMPDGVTWLPLGVMPRTPLAIDKGLQEKLGIEIGEGYWDYFFMPKEGIDLTRRDKPILSGAQYTINRKTPSEIFGELMPFLKQVESFGIPVPVNGETFAVARMLDKSVNQIRGLEQMFREGRKEEVLEEIIKANQFKA